MRIFDASCTRGSGVWNVSHAGYFIRRIRKGPRSCNTKYTGTAENVEFSIGGKLF